MPESAARRLGPEDRRQLLAVAEASLDHGLARGVPLEADVPRYGPALREPGASFVTLRLDGALRGCTGCLEPVRPLVADVALHAFSSAFRDPRFPPLEAREREAVELHVSVLGPQEPLVFADDAELLAQLEPGRHGLTIEAEGCSATFLPSVWSSLTEPRAFLRALKEKAGLPVAADAVALRAWRYGVEDFA